MSDNIDTTSAVPPVENTKILGRFETQGDLEKSYTELETAFSQKQNWEKKYNADFAVPENYLKDDSIEDIDDEFLNSTSEDAKKLGLTQSQFNKYAKNEYELKLAKDKSIEDSKFEISENISKFMKDNIGLTDRVINLLSKDDIAVYESKYQESLNTSTNVTSSYHNTDKLKSKKEAYKTLKEAERSGTHFERKAAFEKWKSLV
tara:strand:- start:971 stop:1582 length:612 start_codon:yes stop_codon:yes gene_type:complete